MTTNHHAGLGAKLALLGAVALGAAGCDDNPQNVSLPRDQFPSSINLSNDDHVGHQPNVVIIDTTGSLYKEGTNCALLPSNKSLLVPEGSKPSTLDFSGATRSSEVSSEENIQDIVIICQDATVKRDDMTRGYNHIGDLR